MGLTKINQILKKYKELHKKHKESWEAACKRIRDKSNGEVFPNDKAYLQESYNYHLSGYKLFDKMMNELDGKEIFEKKIKKP